MRLLRPVEAIKATEATEATEAVEAIEAIEAVESVEAVEAVEAIEAVEAVEAIPIPVETANLKLRPPACFLLQSADGGRSDGNVSSSSLIGASALLILIRVPVPAPLILVPVPVPVPGPENMLLPLLRKNGFSCFWVQGDWFGAGIVKNGFFGMACMHVMRGIILTRFLNTIVYNEKEKQEIRNKK